MFIITEIIAMATWCPFSTIDPCIRNCYESLKTSSTFVCVCGSVCLLPCLFGVSVSVSVGICAHVFM